MIKVTLKGDVREFESGTTVAEVAKSIGAGLYKAACAGRVDGQVVDLRTALTADCTLEILTFENEDGKRLTGTPHPILWHRLCSIFSQRQSLQSARQSRMVSTMISICHAP